MFVISRLSKTYGSGEVEVRALKEVDLEIWRGDARAIVKRPDVLLCDEPTGALDHATGKLVLEVIQRIVEGVDHKPAAIRRNDPRR